MAIVKKREKPEKPPIYQTVEQMEAARLILFDRMAAHEELMIDLRGRREALNRQLKALEDKKELLEMQFKIANSELYHVIDTSSLEVASLEEDLRHSVVAYFEAQEPDAKDEKPRQIGEGLSVRVTKSYEYDDADAINFAIDRKMPEVLKVDATAFKKLMAIQKQDFVTVKDVPVAVIKTK